MSYLSFNSLNELGVINAYSKKPYNFNFHKLSREEINSEINKLEKELDYKFDYVVIPKQSHTTNIEMVDENNMYDEFKDVDGVLTNMKGIGLGTMSADCQSILLYDKEKEVIGSIHSGWRGTLNGIIKVAINKMIDYYGCNVKDIMVAICPSILQCCFEVDEDVKNMFLEKYGSKYIKSGSNNKYYIDTLSINVDVLNELGVHNIDASEMCIVCNKKVFHSYRGDGVNAGRNLGFIGMRK